MGSGSQQTTTAARTGCDGWDGFRATGPQPSCVYQAGNEVTDAQRAVAAIPGAELRVITDGCHHGLRVNDDAADHQAFVLDWLKSHRTR